MDIGLSNYQSRKRPLARTSRKVGAAAAIEQLVAIIPSNTFKGFGKTAGNAGLKTAITTPAEG
jgi:hypothetical protein